MRKHIIKLTKLQTKRGKQKEKKKKEKRNKDPFDYHLHEGLILNTRPTKSNMEKKEKKRSAQRQRCSYESW